MEDDDSFETFWEDLEDRIPDKQYRQVTKQDIDEKEEEIDLSCWEYVDLVHSLEMSNHQPKILKFDLTTELKEHYFSIAMGHCKCLEKVELFMGAISAKFFGEKIMPLLKRAEKLREIVLWCEFESPWLGVFLKEMNYNRNVTKLVLKNFPVDDNVLGELAGLIENNKFISKLYIIFQFRSFVMEIWRTCTRRLERMSVSPSLGLDRKRTPSAFNPSE